MVEEFNITKHLLVPQHTKLSEEERKNLLEEFNIKLNQLPKILEGDAAIQNLGAEVGDIIKIIRKSPTNGKQDVYRVVVHG
jgi:DNA-directed RNA polymerase subunit H